MPVPQLVTIDSADPFERGRQRGLQVAEGARRTWPIYEQLFAATAIEAGGPPVDVDAVAVACLDATSSWSPTLLRELEGVAAGADLPLERVMALNARTEILAHAGRASVGKGSTECSAVVQLPEDAAEDGGRCITGQTWDWHADLDFGWHVQQVHGTDRGFVGLSEHGLLAKIGVNDAGVGVHFNLLRHISEATAADGGVPVHLVSRQVLGSATTLSEAIEIVRSASVIASTVLTVAAPDGVACVEMSPAGAAVVEPSDGWLVHTNNFEDPTLARGEGVDASISTTFDREVILRDRTKAVAGPLDVAGVTELLCTHVDDGVAVCRHLDESMPFLYRTATLATVVLEPAAHRATVRPGGPCSPAATVTLVA